MSGIKGMKKYPIGIRNRMDEYNNGKSQKALCKNIVF